MHTYGISVVVPMKNEGPNLEKLHREIKEACEQGMDGEPFDYEILFIDDGSTDNTEAICKTLTPLKYIRFRKSFGQTAAMDAGFHAARFPYIVAMDGDGQNDPADIPRLLKYLLEQDLDVVSGWRVNRKDTLGKRFFSRGANVLRQILIKDGIHDSGCSLKIYKKECFEDFYLYGEQHRFIPALLKIRGFQIGEIPVNHREREHGRTKYNFLRVFKGICDMISVWFNQKYASRPLHILGTMGMFSFFASFCMLIWLVISLILGASTVDLILPVVLMATSFVTGIILFVLGIMSENLMRIQAGVMRKRPYEIKKTWENQG